jgi:hypothetical protein
MRDGFVDIQGSDGCDAPSTPAALASGSRGLSSEDFPPTSPPDAGDWPGFSSVVTVLGKVREIAMDSATLALDWGRLRATYVQFSAFWQPD